MQNPSVIDLFQQIAGNQFGYFSRLAAVGDVMVREIPTVSCDDTFMQLVQKNQATNQKGNFSQGFQSAAVVDPLDGEMIGVLNRSTVLRCYPRHLDKLSEQDGDREILKSTIATMATRPIPTVSVGTDLLNTLERLTTDHNDFLMVCDDADSIVGCISQLDIVSVMSVYYQVYRQPQPLQRLRLVDLEDLSLDDIFFRGALTARDVMSPAEQIVMSEKASTALQRLHQLDKSHLVVTDTHEKVVGLVGREDFLLALQPPANPQMIDMHQPFPRMEDLLVGDVEPVLLEPVSGLVSKVNVVEPTFRFSDVLESMLNSNGSALLVQENGAIQGVVTMEEVLKIFKTLLLIGEWNTDNNR